MAEYHYDIIIIGAGIVGLTLACALQQQTKLQIAIVEAHQKSIVTPDAGYDTRVFAINRAAQNVFTHLQIWQQLPRTTPYHHMHVWDDFGALNFSCNEIAQSELGHIIEQSLLLHALEQSLTDVTWYQPADTQFLYLGEKALLALNSGERLTAELIVGADGAHSWLRQQAKIKLHEWDYGHTAIIANVSTEKPHQNTAWQRFLAQGPLAFLPLPDPHLCSIVWSTNPEKADYLIQLSDADFLMALQDNFAKQLGACTQTSKRYAFPLRMRHAQHYVLPHIALLGDAAHTIHPLAGLGINLGIIDAACLAQILCDAEDKASPIGSLYYLRRYERWRKGDNLLMIAAMESLKRLFSYHPLRFTRNLGMNWLDQISPLKKQLIYKAIGYSSDLPKLARTSDQNQAH